MTNNDKNYIVRFFESLNDGSYEDISEVLSLINNRHLGKIYTDMSRYNKYMMKEFSKKGLFPICRGWEHIWDTKFYYVTYKIFKNSDILKSYEIIACYPNTLTEYEDFYLVSFFISTYPIKIPQEIII